ncbi:MAG: hypothetical protein GY869_13405, partial [Planctomycetes bacterium]|nr:hypothetical protein [Planctomycetota bacterium]
PIQERRSVTKDMDNQKLVFEFTDCIEPPIPPKWWQRKPVIIVASAIVATGTAALVFRGGGDDPSPNYLPEPPRID